ncbi:MAG: hypothetical protein AAGA60_11190 [Cyanobacteria bacterium P01_E01_bin.42]
MQWKKSNAEKRSLPVVKSESWRSLLHSMGGAIARGTINRDSSESQPPSA